MIYSLKTKNNMILIAFDSLDEVQGTYFTKCSKELKNHLPLYLENKVELVFEQNLNFASVGLKLEEINDDAFILSAFCHGTKLSLNGLGRPFLKLKENSNLLKNGLVYTNACSAGQDFGRTIINEGVIAFVGYDREVDSLISEELLPISIRCDVYALHLFLHKNNTLRDAEISAKKFITAKSREILKNGDRFAAAKLIANRDAMIIHGNDQITFNELFQIDANSN